MRNDFARALVQAARIARALGPPGPRHCWGRLLLDAEEDLLGYMRFPGDHWPKIRSTNPLERVNLEIARRSDVVGIYPNDEALLRLAASLLIEQNDEWLVQHRYLSLESLTALREAAQHGPDGPADDDRPALRGGNPAVVGSPPRNGT
jgi:putative transposase